MLESSTSTALRAEYECEYEGGSFGVGITTGIEPWASLDSDTDTTADALEEGYSYSYSYSGPVTGEGVAGVEYEYRPAG